jgi:SulP family sulfate permease
MGDSEHKAFRFDRMEWSGSLGDLGTLLPLAIGMIVISGLEAGAVLGLAGLYYILAGLYFRSPTPVQPMKVVAAYAIAAGLSAAQISAATLWLGVVLLLLGATGLVDWLKRLVPQATVRGIQLAVGAVLAIKGVALIVEVDPELLAWRLGPLHLGVLLGLAGLVLTFLLIDSRRFPAALVLVVLGLCAGLLLGRLPSAGEVSLGLHLPTPLAHGWPGWDDALWVLPAVVLPQLPTTLGNAIYSNVDVSRQLYPAGGRLVTYRAVTLSMGLANLAAFFFGGMPMCHGAGGVAAHHRFGARTGGANLIIGGLLLIPAVVLGDSLLPVLGLLPKAVLGVLLFFAGLQLALMIQDVTERRDLFVVISMLVVALAVDLAIAFAVGVALAWALRLERLRV